MGRSRETYNKKEVRKKKEKKKKQKDQRRQEKKENNKSSMDDMIAYVDENGNITNTPPDPEDKEDIEAEDIEIGISKQDPALKKKPEKTGKVTFFNESKGFGFIEDTNTRERLFFHVNNLIDDVEEEDRVTFEMEKGPRGPVAKDVRLIKTDD